MRSWQRIRAHGGAGAQHQVPDPVRFTFTSTAPIVTLMVCSADVERLKEIGFEEIKLKNLWSDEQYKGINSQWRRPETGLRIEVQFHTPASLEAKELTHKAYERIRSPRHLDASRTQTSLRLSSVG